MSHRTWAGAAIVRRSLLTTALVAALGLAGFVAERVGPGLERRRRGVVAHSDTEVDRVAAGAGWVALSSSWSRLEPTNGDYSVPAWDALEAHLQHAKAQGLRVELTLTGAPSWATGFTGTGVPPTPANYPRYASFLSALAKRMGPLVDAWILWNEPNHPNYWATPDPVAYTHLMQAAYPAVKAADPSSVVLMGPFAPTGPGLNGNGGSGAINPYDFLISAYSAGIRGYGDAVAWNLYPPGAPEDTFLDSSGRPYAGSFPGQLYLHSLLQARDPGLHVWITEFGWSTCTCQQNLINGVDEATQADYLGRAWTYERRYLPWVDVMFWFEAQDSNASPSTWERGLGLLRNDGSAKPAYQALGTVANQAGGAGGGGGGGTGTGTGGGGGGTGTTTTGNRSRRSAWCRRSGGRRARSSSTSVRSRRSPSAASSTSPSQSSRPPRRRRPS